MKVAILIPAHNEAGNIERAIKSARGYDTYVVNDNSTDNTAAIAKRNGAHVLSVNRGGKGRALHALIDHYDICNNYGAFIILDGDSYLAEGAVEAFVAEMKPGVGGAVGNMKNWQNNIPGLWRAMQYMEVGILYRRGMAAVNCIHVMCGTCSIWSTELFKQLDWDDTPVEDMDHTYQMHRKKIGRITYASKANVYTQEPKNMKDYRAQMLRWLRGYWLTTAKYKTPFGGQSLDFGQALLILECALNWARFLAIPLLPFTPYAKWIIFTFIGDAIILFFFTTVASVYFKKIRYIAFYPLFVGMYVLDTALNFYAFLTYRKTKSGTWKSPERLTSKS